MHNIRLHRREAVERGQAILAPDTPGSQLAPGLVLGDLPLECARLLSGEAQVVGDREIIVYKPRWGAFYQTRLEDHLRRWAINTTVFTGCNFPNCPRASIAEASERDFRVVVVGDAISGVDEKGKAEMANIGGTPRASDYELQRRVSEAERGIRESRLWILAVISAIASVLSAAAAMIAVWK